MLYNATFVPLMESAVQLAVNIRPLGGQSDLEAAVALQQAVWGYSDLEVDSRAVLTIASRFIGQVLGAFYEERMIGLALAFATVPFGRLHSLTMRRIRSEQSTLWTPSRNLP